MDAGPNRRDKLTGIKLTFSFPTQVNSSFPVDNTPTRISVPDSGSFVRKDARKTKVLTCISQEGFS